MLSSAAELAPHDGRLCDRQFVDLDQTERGPVQAIALVDAPDCKIRFDQSGAAR